MMFEPLSLQQEDGTLWTGANCPIPEGELTLDWQAAWLGGAFHALYGAPAQAGPDHDDEIAYSLRTTSTERPEVRLLLRITEEGVHATFGRFVHGVEDPTLFEAVRAELLALIETTTPVNFASRSFGWKDGAPWTGSARKKERFGAHPYPGSISSRDPVDIFVARVRSATTPASVLPEPTQAELRAYYAANPAPGDPPFEAVARFVRDAVLAERARGLPVHEVRSSAIGRMVDDVANLALFDFVPLARAYRHVLGVAGHRSAPLELDAQRGVRKFRGLAELIDAVVTGRRPEPTPAPRAEKLPMHQHADEWREVAGDLREIAAMLEPHVTFEIDRTPR